MQNHSLTMMKTQRKLSNKQKKMLCRILTAAIVYAAILILDHVTAYFHFGFFQNWIVLLCLYLIPYLIIGWDVLRDAGLGIKNRQMFDEKFLMVLASIGAIAAGQYAESVAVMLFYQVGEFFQDYAVNKSRRSIQDLMDIAPETANIERPDGVIETIDPGKVEIGNILVVRPGEKIPVDGTVLSGQSLINTAALTGESVPRSVGPNDTVISGCINGDVMLRIRADKKYEDSTVARILDLVENASSKKSHTENFITKFARYYTPIVVLAAAVLAVVPSLITGDVIKWIYRACTFLVISCPCALVISVPLSFFGGIGAASALGVLVKGSNYLEQLAHLDTIVSDKTGTLTRGEFRVSRIEPANGVSESELLNFAAAAEGMSTHPIAHSIYEAWKRLDTSRRKEIPVLSVENFNGLGLAAQTTDGTIFVGSSRLMEKNNIEFRESDDPIATISYVALNHHFLGAIAISDTIKPEAPQAIASLKREGVRRIVMLTGDRSKTALATAQALNIQDVCSELLPEDKVEKVEQLLESDHQAGRTLAFVGDGTNDAPVLMRADVGIAMGSLGSDAAIEAADIVIMDDSLMRLPLIIRIAKKTIGIARQNIIFAIAVKLLIMILGAVGIANMWAAVFADVGVAIICILNSMRTLIKKRYIQADDL